MLLLFGKGKPVQRPGSRGGLWYRDKRGEVQYGTPPTGGGHVVDEEVMPDEGLHRSLQRSDPADRARAFGRAADHYVTSVDRDLLGSLWHATEGSRPELDWDVLAEHILMQLDLYDGGSGGQRLRRALEAWERRVGPPAVLATLRSLASGWQPARRGDFEPEEGRTIQPDPVTPLPPATTPDLDEDAEVLRRSHELRRGTPEWDRYWSKPLPPEPTRGGPSGPQPSKHPDIEEAAIQSQLARFRKAATFAKPAPANGEHVLGKTRKGRPVYASGGDASRYDDDEHQDAAKLHAKAAAYHEDQAAMHAKTRDQDKDWKRSEQHHGEHDRHAKLRDHHFERTQEHIIAGGKGEEAEFDGTELKNRRPVDGKKIKKTKDGLAKRLHHDHPGGHNEADLAQYATFTKDDNE